MDHRDVAALKRNGRFDEKRMVLALELEDENGDEEIVWVPARFEICWTCRGKGSCVNPSIDAHGLTREDFYDDPDFAEDYFRGVYDIPCPECGGKRVVPVVDEECCDAELVKRWQEQEQARWDEAREQAHGIEMGY